MTLSKADQLDVDRLKCYIGKRIRKARRRLNMTQREVSSNCRISIAFLSDVENGKRSIGLIKIMELSRVFSCKIDWFVRGYVS